jgi:sulfur-carrier protein
MQVTVRYFAAARAAANTEAESVQLEAGTTLAALVESLAARSPELAQVLPRCSYLCDEIAVRDTASRLSDGQTIDVLPPFAGG